MLSDKLNMFSDSQAITATAVSTNTIDMGDPQWSSGIASPGVVAHGGRIVVTVEEDFDVLTSLTIALQSSFDDAVTDAFSDVITRAPILLAGLTAGTEIHLGTIPVGTERYARLNYTVTGTVPTTGILTSAIVMDVDANY